MAEESNNNKNRRRWISPTTLLTAAILVAGLIVQYTVLGSTVDSNSGDIGEIKGDVRTIGNKVYDMNVELSVHEVAVGHPETVKKIDELNSMVSDIKTNQAVIQRDINQLTKTAEDQQAMLREILNRLPHE